MLKIKNTTAAMALVLSALLPAGAQAADAALSPLPYLGAVIAHQGNEALRIIRAQVREDIRHWLPALEGVEQAPQRAAASARPRS